MGSERDCLGLSICSTSNAALSLDFLSYSVEQSRRRSFSFGLLQVFFPGEGLRVITCQDREKSGSIFIDSILLELFSISFVVSLHKFDNRMIEQTSTSRKCISGRDKA